MSKPKVFVTRSILDAGLDIVRDFCEADIWSGELPPPREVLLERVKGVEGILSLLTSQIDDEVMAAAGTNLKVISNYAVGYDNIDIPAATRRGVPVGNTPGVLTDTTADFAFALLMAAARRVVEADVYARAGKWRTWGPSLLLGQDITGATLGIIGFGRIGKGMAKRAQGFDMEILYYSPNCPPDPYAAEIGAHCVDLTTLLERSDFVSVHVPLNDQTHHLINKETLRMMKPSAVLINTARGPVVDTEALYEALRDQVIGYAALDVTDPEPIPADHPLLELENVIVAPHIASASYATRGKMATMAAENLIAGLKGEHLPNCVNPQVYG
ncbi:MAG: D-glycerate dehydrogenase [Anaerolineae bacterium]|nr:D-glycerate dehydrogenase [Anaerolineae bacterium]MCB9107902.1 D-glycerate dehydrogenase [Anaerolineales bacterium]